MPRSNAFAGQVAVAEAGVAVAAAVDISLQKKRQ